MKMTKSLRTTARTRVRLLRHLNLGQSLPWRKGRMTRKKGRMTRRYLDYDHIIEISRVN